MLEITLNQEQYNKLSGLAYWIADKSYIKERYGDNEPELDRCHKTIIMLFDELDALKVPFWAQNTVICFAENWRRYKETYLRNYLEKKNIHC